MTTQVDDTKGIGASRDSEEKTAFFNDPKVRSIAIQATLIAIMAYLVYSLIHNTGQNLAAQGRNFSFGFLDNPAGFPISQNLISYQVGASSYLQVYFIGLLNTLLVAIIGIILATILGFIIGVARLSPNWVVSKAAYCYVEVMRNIPLLLWLFIFYFGVLRLLPQPRQALGNEYIGFLSNRGGQLPKPVAGDLLWFSLVGLVVAIVGCIIVSRWAKQRQIDTGKQFPVFWTCVGMLVGIPLLVFLLTGMPLTFDLPKMGGFKPTGGMTIIPEFIALLTALVIYTASFIAEVVRAGILAVNKGQTEAAHALGLRQGPTLNLVIIPQALRVIIPPLTNQYLNLTKNSSLAVAIAYPDLVSVFTGTALNQSGREVEIVLMTMLTYLTLSLLTSAFMNWYNNKMALVER